MKILLLDASLSLASIRCVFYLEFWDVKWIFLLLLGLNLIALGLFCLLMKLAFNKRVFEKQRASQHRNILFQLQIVTQEIERRRIGRDLHDRISNKLSLILLKLNNEYPTDQLETDMIQILVAIRNMAHDLNPPFQSDSPLHLMIIYQIEKLKPAYSIHKTIRIYCNGGESGNFKIQIIRIVQELMTNIVKHAKATEVGVDIRISPKGIYLSIEDNGIGQIRLKEGQGYYNIKNRLFFLKGVFKIKKNRQCGTKIILLIPHETQDNSS